MADGEGHSSRHGHTDIAALSAAVVAVAVALYVVPGEFGLINFITSFVLISVILGFVWDAPRDVTKSVAIAAIVGFATMPAIGFFDEAFRSPDPARLLLGRYEWNCNKDKCKANGEHESRIWDSDLAFGWFVVMVAAFVADRSFQSGAKGPRP